jgi:hypothetical protein
MMHWDIFLIPPAPKINRRVNQIKYSFYENLIIPNGHGGDEFESSLQYT